MPLDRGLKKGYTLNTQAPEDNSEVEFLKELERQRYEYLVRGDADGYSQLCHADLVFVHATGTRETRESFISALQSGTVRYQSADRTMNSVSIVRETAVILGDVDAEILINAQSVQIHNRVVATWVRVESKWLLLGHAGVPLTNGL